MTQSRPPYSFETLVSFLFGNLFFPIHTVLSVFPLLPFPMHSFKEPSPTPGSPFPAPLFQAPYLLPCHPSACQALGTFIQTSIKHQSFHIFSRITLSTEAKKNPNDFFQNRSSLFKRPGLKTLLCFSEGFANLIQRRFPVNRFGKTFYAFLTESR